MVCGAGTERSTEGVGGEELPVLLEEQQHRGRGDNYGQSRVDTQSEDGEFVAQGKPPCRRWVAAP